MPRLLTLWLLALAGSSGAQAPASDLFLVPLRLDGSRIVLGTARNITGWPGYDNQPSWSPDGSAIYFSSVRDGVQADIYRYRLTDGALDRITASLPESEYSPSVIEQGRAISVVMVERDSTQRLWRIPLDGSAPRPILERIARVGYYAWLSDTSVAFFLLGSPNALVLASASSADTIARNVGRSLQRIPGRDALSYVHKVGSSEWWLVEFDVARRENRRLVRLPSGVEDYTWLPDGRALVGQGSALLVWTPGSDGWALAGELGAEGLTGITRLAVSPRTDFLVLVAVPAQR
jgi:dipeptidyl aminopeptidase/acylaminoacyl peptidase